MNKQIVDAKRAYMKAWRARNKDKVKAANARFYAKYAAKMQKEVAEAADTVTADTVSN